jgi:uncharacterized protein YxjI
MKRYFLREKLFSIGGDAMITDQSGRELFFVDGKAISFGRRLEIKDMDGHSLATIQQTLLTLTPTFQIDNPGGSSARVSLKLLSLRDRLKIDVPGWDDLEAVGDLFHHEYTISRGGRQVAQVSKRWLALTDSYGIEIAEDEDQILLLASAVVIDEILDLRQRADK